MRRALTFSVLALSFGLAGCYTYMPVQTTVLAPDQRVRMTITTERAVALEAALYGPRRTFTAMYVGRQGQDLMFQVQLRNEVAGMSTRGLYNRLSIPVSDIVVVEERTLSKWRTGAAIGIVVVAVAGAGIGVLGGDDAGDREGPILIDESVVLSIPIG